MPRTNDAWYATTPQIGAFAFVDGSKIMTWAPNGAPLPSFRMQGGISAAGPSGTTGAIVYSVCFSDLPLRVVLPPSFPGEAPVPKGIRPIDIWAVVTVGAGVTSAVLHLYSTEYVDGGFPNLVDIPLNQNLSMAPSTNMAFWKASVITPQFIATDNTDLVVELQSVVSAPNLVVFGIGMHYDFNFN